MATEYDGDHIDLRGANVAGSVTAKAVYREHAPAPSALDALPARAVGFTGREAELRELLDAFDPAVPGDGPEAVVVAAVSGLGGIGKTALAVQAGYEACGRGWFPGGVLFVDLHGYDEEPVTGDQALEALLRALGIEPEHIPVGLDARAVLYRSALADRAREKGPVLVLADNASSPAQVRPLLPGGAGHRLLVTSRDRLPQLGARLLALDELTPEEANDLLDRALRIAHPVDNRVSDDSEEAARLAVLCGHLPLALQIAAALLVVDRGKPVAELVAELAESRDRLAHLDDGERSVRAAFDLSYNRLPPEQARVLRLLALAPGPDASNEVVAALGGEGAPAIRVLEALVRAHLVERGRGRGRWRLHDLVRVYGMCVVAGNADHTEEGDAARMRVLAFYRRRSDAADSRLQWLPGRPEPELFDTRAQALAWLDGERAGLTAAVQWAVEERFAEAAIGLANCLGAYLSWRRYFGDWIAVARISQHAARNVDDRYAEAHAWNSLGFALREADQAVEAIDAHTRARELSQAVGDRDREAAAWGGLGFALQKAGRAAEAIDAHTRARDMCQATDDGHHEAMAWNGLGIALLDTGRVPEAIDAYVRACNLFRSAGDRHREGRAWNNLGFALRKAGRVAEAIEAHAKDLDICWQLQDWYGAGQTLANLARACEVANNLSMASDYWLRAAHAYTQADAHERANHARLRAGSPNTRFPLTP